MRSTLNAKGVKKALYSAKSLREFGLFLCARNDTQTLNKFMGSLQIAMTME